MIVAEQAVVAGPHAGALAVAVAATLRGAVVADKAEVAAAVVGLHTRAVHAALGAHGAAQPRHAAGVGQESAQGSGPLPPKGTPSRPHGPHHASEATTGQPTLFTTSPPPGLLHHSPVPGPAQRLLQG